MKVCDKHPDRQSHETVLIVNDDQHFDLCSECKTDLLRFLTEPRIADPKRGRPRKLSA